MWICVLILFSSFPLRSKSFKPFYLLPEEMELEQVEILASNSCSQALQFQPQICVQSYPANGISGSGVQAQSGAVCGLITRSSSGKKQICSLPLRARDPGPLFYYSWNTLLPHRSAPKSKPPNQVLAGN